MAERVPCSASGAAKKICTPLNAYDEGDYRLHFKELPPVSCGLRESFYLITCRDAVFTCQLVAHLSARGLHTESIIIRRVIMRTKTTAILSSMLCALGMYACGGDPSGESELTDTERETTGLGAASLRGSVISGPTLQLTGVDSTTYGTSYRNNVKYGPVKIADTSRSGWRYIMGSVFGPQWGSYHFNLRSFAYSGIWDLRWVRNSDGRRASMTLDCSGICRAR